MHLQSLKLLRPIVYEEMHLQANTLFDLGLGVKVIQHATQCAIHHVTYAAAKFEVASSIDMGADTKNAIFDLEIMAKGHMKCCPVPSTICDLCSCKVRSCYL